MVKFGVLVLSAGLAAGATLLAQSPTTSSINVVPLPSSLTAGPGVFALTAKTVIAVDPAVRAQGRLLSTVLHASTGYDLPVVVGAAPANSPYIALRQTKSKAVLDRLGVEGYQLKATSKGVEITGGAPAGVFYGIQTLRQLLPVENYRSARIATQQAGAVALWTVPVVTIEDKPRFTWRGAHLDVSRHFMPKEFVKKYIDLLALHKMNRFHWHLTDDQGWRLEIKQYPKLTEVGAWRDKTLIGKYVKDPKPEQFDNHRSGGFYTQDDAREIVAYAAERFVTVIPEIEMPGHSEEVVAAYPEFGSTDQKTVVRQTWAVSPFILSPDDATVKFMQNVLGEVLSIFPSPWIHIGGDEATKDQWKANPKIQARIKELGLKNEDELQSWFIRQMDGYLTSKGRRLIGWDEILEGGLAENATVMAWRDVNHAMAAARSGHDAVMTPTSHTYLDYYQTRDVANEPLNIGGFLPLDKVYSYDPMPAQLEKEFQRHILGVQGQLWTEYLQTGRDVEWNAFPRLIALAEVGWTAQDKRQYPDFLARLKVHLQRLKILDVNVHPLG